MKILDLILICLISVLLLNTGYDLTERLFADANSWIPSVFSDAVSWHPGKTFFWGVTSIVCGLFLCRFADRPLLMAFVAAVLTVGFNLYPSVDKFGINVTLNQLFSSYDVALEFLQLIGLLPVITWLLQWLIEPSREHEVIAED